MNDDVTLHQKIEGRRGGEKKSKGDCCVFGFCKSDKFFLLQKHILHFGKNWVCQVSFKTEFLN